MKQNRFKRRLAERHFAIGHMISEFGTRGQAKMLERADLDFALIDMEHTGFTSADVADMVAWLKATDIAPFVRIPQIEYHFIARTLDVGALGLMIPNVKTVKEARAVVSAAKYAPLGNRGVGIGAAHSDFKKVNPKEFMAFANENTIIICQIESQEGLDHLEEIAATRGIDVLWVGHFDLSQSLGIPGQFQHDRFLKALEQVAEAAKKAGLAAGIQPGDMEQAKAWMAMGYNVISYSADHTLYMRALTEAISGVRDLLGR